MASNAPATSQLDWLKPRRADAVARLRNNALAAVTLLIAAQLLPGVPSPVTLLLFVLSGSEGRFRSGFEGFAAYCELAFLAIFGVNILQSSYALRYPPGAPPPPDSPAKRAQEQLLKQSQQPRRRTLPISSPTSPTSPSPCGVSAKPRTSGSFYASSPLSTPSRTLTYAPPAASPLNTPFNTSLTSSASSFGMSSPLAAYRGRHSLPPARPIDGNLLSRLQAAEDDD
ncbi:hypothetical protein BD410DRAFT_797051 [Rickenella mellea]|uniref:Uncharacterized protein n=1 Tax=Rickenella mellea TaxID=50990 RepID=A0A4Y7PIH4_9AGAM|nr:hypothetical protein BD410DRAFT_797051 [Rickenella mellea]